MIRQQIALFSEPLGYQQGKGLNLFGFKSLEFAFCFMKFVYQQKNLKTNLFRWYPSPKLSTGEASRMNEYRVYE